MTEIYKFVKWDVPSLEELRDAKAVRLRRHIDNGGRLTRREKDWLTEAVNHNTYFKRAVPVRGWCVPFSDVLLPFPRKTVRKLAGDVGDRQDSHTSHRLRENRGDC